MAAVEACGKVTFRPSVFAIVRICRRRPERTEAAAPCDWSRAYLPSSAVSAACCCDDGAAAVVEGVGDETLAVPERTGAGVGIWRGGETAVIVDDMVCPVGIR
jgi:hypothetical protein